MWLNSTDKLANEWWMYINRNPKALKFQHKRHHFRCLLFYFHFWIAFTVGTEEYYTKCNNVNNAKSLLSLYHCCNIILWLEVRNLKYWLILLDFYWFRWTYYCVLSDLIKRISNYISVLRPFNLQKTNNLLQNHTSQLKTMTQYLSTYLYSHKIWQLSKFVYCVLFPSL